MARNRWFDPDAIEDSSREEEEEEQDYYGSKRASRKRMREDCYEKSSRFKRVWSVEDESTLLYGMLQFRSENNKEANRDYKGFFEFVKGSIHAKDVSVQQLSNKIRKLKYRFVHKAEKVGEKSFVFHSFHDEKLFKVSKRIWGAANSHREKKKKKQ